MKDWIRGLYEKKMQKAAKKKVHQQKTDSPRVPAACAEAAVVEDESLEGCDDDFDFERQPRRTYGKQTGICARRRQEFRTAAEAVSASWPNFPRCRKSCFSDRFHA